MMPTLRVYIAEDSAPVRERLQARLAEMTGVELVGQTSRGLEAIEAIRRLRPDIAILDIRMPGASGIEVLQAVKQGASPPAVIMLTAFAYPQHWARCLAMGADYFFDKADEFENVFAVLEQMQAARVRRRQTS